MKSGKSGRKTMEALLSDSGVSVFCDIHIVRCVPAVPKREDVSRLILKNEPSGKRKDESAEFHDKHDRQNFQNPLL